MDTMITTVVGLDLGFSCDYTVHACVQISSKEEEVMTYADFVACFNSSKLAFEFARRVGAKKLCIKCPQRPSSLLSLGFRLHFLNYS
jgi:hypothetical protein